ncbi:MAG: metallophosphoesterase [bacterium]|nr:metallophosphoesterase [bacterium]
MKRFLVFSDSHGSINNCEDVINHFQNQISGIIHAGDYARDAEDLESIYKDIPVYYVHGNTDYMSRAPGDLTFEIDGVRIFLTHGHEYFVKKELCSGYGTLLRKAKEERADLCIFGHTHISTMQRNIGVTLLNPGSIRFNGEYAIVGIENGDVKIAQMKLF